METLEELKKEVHIAECSNESDPKCAYCSDTGFVVKTEWAGTDNSYEVSTECVHRED